MTDGTPRLRMFAGPNGSGKSTVKNHLRKSEEWYGLYVNPDELENSIRTNGVLATGPLGISMTTAELQDHFLSSSLLKTHGLANDGSQVRCDADVIDFRNIAFNSYHASVLSDLLRRIAMRGRRSFSFETVMSSRDKVDFLKEVREQGYRTYLYFIATEDPAINIQRVKWRVQQGGHDVPVDKIVDAIVVRSDWRAKLFFARVVPTSSIRAAINPFSSRRRPKANDSSSDPSRCQDGSRRFGGLFLANVFSLRDRSWPSNASRDITESSNRKTAAASRGAIG